MRSSQISTLEFLLLALSFEIAHNLNVFLVQNFHLVPYFIFVGPVGSVVKNPHANAEDMGSIPGLKRLYVPQSS